MQKWIFLKMNGWIKWRIEWKRVRYGIQGGTIKAMAIWKVIWKPTLIETSWNICIYEINILASPNNGRKNQLDLLPATETPNVTNELYLIELLAKGA